MRSGVAAGGGSAFSSSLILTQKAQGKQPEQISDKDSDGWGRKSADDAATGAHRALGRDDRLSDRRESLLSMLALNIAYLTDEQIRDVDIDLIR